MRRLNEKIRRWWRSLDAKYLRPGYEPSVPFEINIETSSICNLRCSCCPHGVARCEMRKPGIMTAETFRRVMDHIDIPLKRVYLHLHGEPFLNPDLPSFVEELTQRKIPITLYSNAMAVKEEQLEAILRSKQVTMTFSADLLSKEYYEAMRVGSNYEACLQKLDALNEVFVRCNRFFNIVIILDAEWVEKTDEVAAACERLYERYSRLNGILLGSKFPWPRLPLTGDLVNHLAPARRKRCNYAFEGLSILWNGDATLCSFDYTGECVVGSLLDHTYTEVFNNSAARHFRMLHWRHQDDRLPLCKDCLLDQYVPSSVNLHRASFLKKDNNEKRQLIQSFRLV